jgi:hypothetical protein
VFGAGPGPWAHLSPKIVITQEYIPPAVLTVLDAMGRWERSEGLIRPDGT